MEIFVNCIHKWKRRLIGLLRTSNHTWGELLRHYKGDKMRKLFLIISLILIFSIPVFADEWHDAQVAHFGGEFGTKDLLVDGAGILAGIGFVYFIEF